MNLLTLNDSILCTFQLSIFSFVFNISTLVLIAIISNNHNSMNNIVVQYSNCKSMYCILCFVCTCFVYLTMFVSVAYFLFDL